MLLPAEMALTIRSEFPRIARELNDESLSRSLVRLAELNLFTLVSFAPRAVTLKISGWEAFEVSVGHAEHEDPAWSLGRCLMLLAERANDPRLAHLQPCGIGDRRGWQMGESFFPWNVT